MKTALAILAVVLTLLVSYVARSADLVALTWDFNPPDNEVTHYKVFHGTESGHYTRSAGVGNTNRILAAVKPGTNVFVVTALRNEVESAASKEVIYFLDVPQSETELQTSIATVPGERVTLLELSGTPENGTISWNGTALIYQSKFDYIGRDMLMLDLSPMRGSPMSAVLNFTVEGTAEPTVFAVEKTMVVSQARGINGTILRALPESTLPTTFVISTQPTNGVLSGKSPGILYRPTPGFLGDDTFYYQALRDGAISAPAAVLITVTP